MKLLSNTDNDEAMLGVLQSGRDGRIVPLTSLSVSDAQFLVQPT